MTAPLMRAHIAAGVWHFQRAAQEAPTSAWLPSPVRAVVDDSQASLADFGIDGGYLAEQGHRDTHTLPDELEEAKEPKRSKKPAKEDA
jgi:hypothetical protein